MALMPWSDDLALGIASLDEQHQALVKLLNTLHEESSRASPDGKAIGRALEDLVDAAMNHFVAEEELLKRHGDAQTEAHIQTHGREIETLVQALNQISADHAALGQDVLIQFKDWLTRHIQVDDKASVPLLKSKGAS